MAHLEAFEDSQRCSRDALHAYDPT
jgi:hypothetical protein